MKCFIKGQYDDISPDASAYSPTIVKFHRIILFSAIIRNSKGKIKYII